MGERYIDYWVDLGDDHTVLRVGAGGGDYGANVAVLRAMIVSLEFASI